MELTTVKEIYRNREQYLDKEITADGYEAFMIPRLLHSSYSMMEAFLKLFRSYIMITWRISQRFPS